MRAPDEGGGVEVVQLIKVEKRRQVREHLVSYPVPGQTFSTFCKPLKALMYPKKIINYIISILNSLLVVGVYNCSTITSCLLILHFVDSQTTMTIFSKFYLVCSPCWILLIM